VTVAPDEAAARLAVPPAAGRFDPESISDLPEPARRYLGRAIEPGTPLYRSVRLSMRGRIRVGARWLGFRADEVLAPDTGFVWRARAAGLISGHDLYVDGAGELRWKLLGLVPVARATGADIARSGAGRAAGEAVWLPTALVPSAGAHWAEDGDGRPSVTVRTGDHTTTGTITLDADGLPAELALDRWGDPDGTGEWGRHRFGMVVTDHRRFDGITVPSRGIAGWHPGSDRWADGQFFRFELTGVRPVTTDG
jgi:hypothetical protein